MEEPTKRHIERLIKQFKKAGFTDLQAKVLAERLTPIFFDEKALDEAIEKYLLKESEDKKQNV